MIKAIAWAFMPFVFVAGWVAFTACLLILAILYAPVLAFTACQDVFDGIMEALA